MMHRLLMALVFLVFTLLFTWQVVNITRDLTLQRLHQQGSDELLKVITELRSALGQYRYLPFLISQNVSVKELLAFSKSEKSAEVSLYLEQTNLVAGSSCECGRVSGGVSFSYASFRGKGPRRVWLGSRRCFAARSLFLGESSLLRFQGWFQGILFNH